jgi:membrane-bound ClpP family serine protease
MKPIRIFLFSLLAFLFIFQPARAFSEAPLVMVMNIDGPIAPAVQEYLSRSIEHARREHRHHE